MTEETIDTLTGGRTSMRAALAADIADACQIIERVRTTAHLAGFGSPTDLSLFRGNLAALRRGLTAKQCELHALTFTPSDDPGEKG